MNASLVFKDDEYILNHCSRHLARDNSDDRHNYLGVFDQQKRGRISEAWRFPIIDAHDGPPSDRYLWNDVTFVYAAQIDGPQPLAVELVTTCHSLYEPLPLKQVGDSMFWALTLRVPRAQRHRYKFVVDRAVELDAINPQLETLLTGDVWSSFFTWAYNQPISFERWEYALLDRLTRHILPFNTEEAKIFLENGANEQAVPNLYRLDIGLGAVNYIDKIVAREERHRLSAYKVCLELLDRVLRKRNPGTEPELLEESHYLRLYHELAGDPNALVADGWDLSRYDNPAHFLWMLRRHAWTGAFAHPKYGGNPGGMAWAYLEERYKTSDDKPPVTAFDWRRAIEQPLGTSEDYLG